MSLIIPHNAISACDQVHAAAICIARINMKRSQKSLVEIWQKKRIRLDSSEPAATVAGSHILRREVNCWHHLLKRLGSILKWSLQQ